MKWEYAYSAIKLQRFSREAFEEVFNQKVGQRGEEDWELVSVTETLHNNGSMEVTFYFKRPKEGGYRG